MKKLTALLLAFVMLIGLSTVIFAHGGIGVYMNGVRIEKDGMILSDRTYLPVRALCNSIGLSVEWVEATKSVVLGDKPDFTAYTGVVNIYLNGTLMENAEAVIIDGTTYLPVRALCEKLNMTVEWKEETREVHITYEFDFFNSPGVCELDEDERKQLAVYMNTKLPNGDGFRSALEEMLKADYYSLSAAEQKAGIRELLKEPVYSQVPVKEVPEKKAEYAVNFVQYDSSYDIWQGECAPVWKYEVIMDGKGEEKHLWSVFATDDDKEAVEEFASIVARFPYAVRKVLKRLIYINSFENTTYGKDGTIWVKISYKPKDTYLYPAVANCMGYLLNFELEDMCKTKWMMAELDDVVPVSSFAKRSSVLDLGEFAKLYLSYAENEEMLKEIEALYPERFSVFAAMLYELDSDEYEKYYTYHQKVTNFKYTGVGEETFTISIPNTDLYLTAPNKDRLCPTFEKYTGEDNQKWTRKIHDGHTVIVAYNTDRCLYAVRGKYNPVTEISTTMGGVSEGYSYVVIGEDTIYFTKDKGYLGPGDRYSYLSDDVVKMDIKKVEE